MQSSANSRTFEINCAGRSMTKARNRRGPMTLPCGIPDVTLCPRKITLAQFGLSVFYLAETR